MNSTSRGSRLVRSAARSPASAITGPEVERKLTPSSRATICAKVVLPSPGGPTNSTWSSASLRARAASIKILRLARAFSWPMKSASFCGRNDASTSSSRLSPATRRLGAVVIITVVPAKRAKRSASRDPYAAACRECTAYGSPPSRGRQTLKVACAQPSSRHPPPVLVRQQRANARHRRLLAVRHDDARLRVVIVDQFAAGAARRHHGDIARLAGLGVPHGDDGVDAAIAVCGERRADRHRLG